MRATKEYYLKVRSTFITLGFINEVLKLDIHFELVFLYDKNNNLIRIIWSMKEKVKIELNEYCYNCADGCCTNYGTITKVNGVEMDSHNQDAATILEKVLNHLGYDAEVINTYNNE